MIEIIDYSDEFAADFKGINLAWLEKYHLTESHDLEVLNDPRGTILDRGGVIYLASTGKQIVGTAALVKEQEGVYELAKIAVIPEWQGKGISKQLIGKCLSKAEEWKAGKIILFSNHQLQTAINLYRKFGFEQVPVVDGPFITADIKMELLVTQFDGSALSY